MSSQELDYNTSTGYEEEGPGVEYEEEEVEVEEGEEGQEEEPTTPVNQPGKVTPTKAVKDVQHQSPESLKNGRGNTLSPANNPFTAMGHWTPETFSQIGIAYPVFGPKLETTNELTRSNAPEKRFWKGTIKFNYATYTSETLRVANVHIPYQPSNNYGEGFVYLCLPGFMAGKFADTGKEKRPTMTAENSLLPDNNRWWKIVNNVTDKAGVIDRNTRKFHSRSLSSIFESTGKGVVVNVVLRFLAKTSTDDKSPLKPTTTQRVVAEVDRMYIESVDVDVQGPSKVSRRSNKPAPVATQEDVASDALMKRLADLGL